MWDRLFPGMHDGAPFTTFGTSHLWALGLTALACALAAVAGWRLRDSRHLRAISATAGAAIVLYELAKIGIMIGRYDSPWRKELPLHLCRFAEVCAGLMLITRSRSLFEPVYFWTFAAGGPADLTPDLVTDFPHPMFIMFFLTHGLSMAAICFAITAFGFRITFPSFRRALLWTLVLFLVVLALDFAIGSNYMYLMKKPEGATIYDHLGPWPWYILSLAGIAIPALLLLYGCFKLGEGIARLLRWIPTAEAGESPEGAPMEG